MSTRIAPEALRVVQAALRDEQVLARYHAKVAHPVEMSCWPWTGGLHPKGHGRFWVGKYRHRGAPVDVVVIAHRFGWAITHGVRSLEDVPVLAHACDEPSCQNPRHLVASTWGENLTEWHRRRWTPGGALRDMRGPGGRARALREALLNDSDVQAALDAGKPALDRDQMHLFTLLNRET